MREINIKSNECIPTTIKVYHRTNVSVVPTILKEGLKVEKATVPRGTGEFQEISRKIQRKLGIPEINRFKAICATMSYPRKEVLNTLKNHGETLLEVDINTHDENTYIANFEYANRAVWAQIDYNITKNKSLLKELEKNLEKYWKSFIPLRRYICENKKYPHEEILVFKNINPTKIKLTEK